MALNRNKMGVAIITTVGDAHGYIIAERIKNSRSHPCYVFDVDLISESHPISVFDDDQVLATDHFGETVKFDEIGAIWWRRFSPGQKSQRINSGNFEDLKSTAIYHSVIAAANLDACCVDVSNPFSTVRAENKLIQLRAARKTGLGVPRTLISNDFNKISDFFFAYGPRCIVKTLSQPVGWIIDAHLVSIDQIDRIDICQSPTIFQEFVPGYLHLRILMMRDRVLAFEFEAGDVDWRRSVPNTFRLVELEDNIRRSLTELQRTLDLTMCIVDMKRNCAGECVFLEINPQGQFLFMEPLSGVELVDIFADFLINEAKLAY